jgi:archaellum component FlaC
MRLDKHTQQSIGEIYTQMFIESHQEDNNITEPKDLKTVYKELIEDINILKDEYETALSTDDQWHANEIRKEIVYLAKRTNKISNEIDHTDNISM